jgi:hypothetical protein
VRSNVIIVRACTHAIRLACPQQPEHTGTVVKVLAGREWQLGDLFVHPDLTSYRTYANNDL